jgi:cyclic beta-1,2-glucan synthetase
LRFALLTDLADAPAKSMPEDAQLIREAIDGIAALNRHYGSQQLRPFFLFHRERLWNPGEGVWMGWERKRGKLHEFNRLLLGEANTPYEVRYGDVDALSGVRYVITLDADTLQPREAARRLVEIKAHPLNRAVLDPVSGTVLAGYTVLQPRTEVKLVSANKSFFTRLYAGDSGLDLYTHAVSDVYQDLFGEGIFVGKGIYDLKSFERSLAGRVPGNSLLSHDLFEGIHGRAALVTDVVLYEDFPPSYLVWAHRLHRWVRGDWQLLPWLLPMVPTADGRRIRSPLSPIDRWKIFDNLRRSLVPPAVMALLLLGWLALPGSPFFWTLAAVLTPAVPLLPGAIGGVFQVRRGTWPRRAFLSLRTGIMRWLLDLAFLPREALLMSDAILTTLIRLTFTRKHLLRWTTAAHAARLFGKETDVRITWRQMLASLVLFAVLGLMVIQDPMALTVAAPLAVIWLLSPLIAQRISRPVVRRRIRLSAKARQDLRNLARRTWHYFEQFISPEGFWLPPDHFQESPRGLVTQRTSPTNIGLAMLSTLAALDLGYINVAVLILRLQNALQGMSVLERHRGHFLNWYDTRTLEPWPPR